MREFIYDITDYRMNEGVTHDDWNTEEIHSLDSFVKWYDDETLEFVVSNRELDGIEQMDFKKDSKKT